VRRRKIPGRSKELTDKKFVTEETKKGKKVTTEFKKETPKKEKE
jgi:hypothetical protein